MEITNFKIKKLFGYMNVDIPIKDNRLILIGVNGTGKTTILTMLFYFLRGDFVELSAYNFEEISAVINGTDYKISYNDLEKSLFELSPKLEKFKARFFLDSSKYSVYSSLLKEEYDMRDLEELIFPLLENQQSIPKDVLGKQLTDIREEFHYINSEGDFSLKDTLIKIENELEGIKILFLPTFRRIEKEFHDIFGFTLSEYLKERIEKNTNSFIQFGASDILQKFNQEFSNSMKQRVVQDSGDLFFPKSEKFIEFAEICNQYLLDAEKEISSDNSHPFPKILSKTHELTPQSLSFGEKQILSIFSELYLSEDDKEYIVIIDEPELSLSVLWQERFLPDILATGKCKFLAAVTHSPFIYNNELEGYSQDISRLISAEDK